MTVDDKFEGWDYDEHSHDDPLGTVSARYSIDNMWDIAPADIDWHGDFRARFAVQPNISFDKTKVRQQMFWQFVNPTIGEFSHDQMAQTYSDVAQDEAWWLHPFNSLFYEFVYKSLGQSGCCFGMSLEAARAHHHMSISNEPIYRYTNDSIRLNEIIVRHGYQLGGDQIDFFVASFLAGDTHDPVRAFLKSRAAYTAGNFPILSLSNDTCCSKGHAVMPG